VCVRFDKKFTVTYYFTITNNFCFMFPSYRKHSELGWFL